MIDFIVGAMLGLIAYRAIEIAARPLAIILEFLLRKC